jgi:hypothetical protein
MNGGTMEDERRMAEQIQITNSFDLLSNSFIYRCSAMQHCTLPVKRGLAPISTKDFDRVVTHESARSMIIQEPVLR